MLNDILAALNDCVWAFDLNTQTHLFISPSVHAILEYQPKDFHQNKELWNEIIDPRDRKEVLTAAKKTKGGESARINLPYCDQTR